MSDYLWSPEEDIPWSRVVAAVPDEAAALEVVLARAKLSLNEFCRWCDGDFESDDPRIDEFLEVAWDHLAHHFQRLTGLRLCAYCRYRSDLDDDPDTGIQVVGAWQRSPAGMRFFGIKGKR